MTEDRLPTDDEVNEFQLGLIASIASVLPKAERESALNEIERLNEVERDGRRRAAARDPRFKRP